MPSLNPPTEDDGQLAYSVQGLADKLGVSRHLIYEMIRTGEITARKLGRRTVILKADIARDLDALDTVESLDPAAEARHQRARARAADAISSKV